MWMGVAGMNKSWKLSLLIKDVSMWRRSGVNRLKTQFNQSARGGSTGRPIASLRLTQQKELVVEEETHRCFTESSMAVMKQGILFIPAFQPPRCHKLRGTISVIATHPLISCHFLTKPQGDLVDGSGQAPLLELICHI